MKQYLDLLYAISQGGTDKPAARANMPGSRSLFGYQFRHNLSEGFPLLTTKKMFWKGIVVELLWFLRGDTNIKYLVDNGVNIWNGDAYNYYLKKCKDQGILRRLGLPEFIEAVKYIGQIPGLNGWELPKDYILGDCGYQYGKVWTNWEGEPFLAGNTSGGDNHVYIDKTSINQITRVIKSLRETPESRRHIVTAVDPAHDTDLALYWCHSMFQFNCRPLDLAEITTFVDENPEVPQQDVPMYYLDCQLYQRSADSILGVPFNIASYALLTHIIAAMINMVPGEFIHTFGDAHVYDNHKEAMAEQLSREPGELPTLVLGDIFSNYHEDIDQLLPYLTVEDFKLEGYHPQPAIKAELSTG